MTEEKKDLTGLLQYSQALEEAGQAPPILEGSLLEEPPIEEIAAFESLEEFAVVNPPPEQPPSEFAAPVLPEELPEAFELSSTPEQSPSSPPLSETAAPFAEATRTLSSPKEIQENPVDHLQKIKKFSENLSVGTPVVSASFPFSLLIVGILRPEEKEKLLDLITRENMGIREIDLEPQFQAGRILIPRISEYAGILLVQALRGSHAELRLGPSDTIFSTTDTRTDFEETSTWEKTQTHSFSADILHPAESIVVTTQESLPGLPHPILIDTLTASAALRSNVVEAETSTEYHETVEALQRELKYKAYRRGASGIIGFKIQLQQLSSPTHYRILALGVAVKPA